MKYINKKLTIEKLSVETIAKRYGTPTYCYSYKQFKQNILNFKKNFKSFSPLICFAIKSNTNLNLIKEIKQFGLGADVVSMGELMMALKAGISPKKIVFSGVGKTSNEINYAINKNILLINAESENEIKEIEKIAKLKKKRIEIGIRLNPNTDAKTLNQISTGKKENKFGINEKKFLELVKYCEKSKNIDLKCLSVHIGSQILDHRPYEKMLRVIDKVVKKAKYNFKFIDLGGGMGISYKKKDRLLNYRRYNSAIKKFLKKNKSKIIFEPGRSIIGNTASLISKVIYVKNNGKKDFIILDAAMNDLIRPALYGSIHKILPGNKTNKRSNKTYEFVGPICESTDKFSSIKNFQELKEKDLVVLDDVGAYGMSLSSNYNLRLKPIEILVKNSKVKVIRKRQTYKDLLKF
ncbi:diaminopimelate decarboxylase [Candidatus Pelagibacter sp.]|nr:diaminopimelate decarboxylase [Candidatus Pelagibacter sp.]